MAKKTISNTFTVNTIIDGEDALSLVLDTYAIAFPTDSDYNVGSALTYTVGVKMFLGNDTQQTITSISTTSSDDGVAVSSISNGVRIVVGEERFVNSVTVTVTAVCSVGSRTAKIILTAAPKGAKGDDGQDGARGKVGRFFYFGGTFDSSDSDPTHTFVVNDSQAPYFEHTENGQKRYHVFNYETNGSYTMAQMWAISSNWRNKPWEVMTNDFKYIITEALFGAYAHLGSFIINEDWMLSQYGELVQPSGNIITVNASNVNTKYSGNAPVVLNGNHTDNGIIVYKVSFNVSSATTITIKLTTSSENNYDFGAVGKVDNDSLLSATASSIKSDTGSVTLLKISGSSASSTISTSISLNAGSHYLYIGYFKDGSSYAGNDNASFSISGANYNLTEYKKTSGMSMSGGPRSVVPYCWFDNTDPEVKTLPTSGYKFRPAFAVDGLTGETYQQSAHIKGTVTATSGSFTNGTFTNATISSGSIGGFTINTDRLYNSNWNAGIDINYDSKTVKIGKNAQGVMNTEDAIIRAENTKTKSTTSDTYNTALYLNAAGAKYNYAFYGSGNGVLNGFMQGYKVHVLTLIGTATYLNLNNGQVQAIASVGTDSDKIVYLPTLENCRNTLGISVNDNTVNFSCCITIINQSAIQNTTYNRDNVYVRGGSQAYTDEITNLTTRPVVLAQGNPKSLNIANCTTCYVVITYIDKRFIANYITTTW